MVTSFVSEIEIEISVQIAISPQQLWTTDSSEVSRVDNINVLL